MAGAQVSQERERLLDQVFGARTLPEIAAARQALREWLQRHSDEPGMADAFEALSHFEDYALQQMETADSSRPVGTR